MRRPGVRRFGVATAWAGLLVTEVAIALTYLGFGTWWHWLLHMLTGWGVGLSAAALAAALTRYRVPAVVALLLGQLVSIVPDLQFRFLRRPHEASMDVFLGHISIHTGPSPVLVALGALLLGGWAWIAAAYDRREPALALGVAGLLLVVLACLVADEIPTRLADFPLDPARVATGR